jgi:DnaK suppressor protein
MHCKKGIATKLFLYFRKGKGNYFMSKRSKKNEYDQLRDLLLHTREELSRRVEQRRQEMMIMDQEPEDEVGVALRNSSTGTAIANIEREVRTLAEIDLSIRRMETGKYGICGVCEETIPMARLKAIPWTRRCVECAGGGLSRGEQVSRRLDRQQDLLSTP